MFIHRSLPVGLLIGLFSYHAAYSGTATNTLEVGLNVVQICSVDSSTLTFPTNQFDASIDTSAVTVTVTCNTGSVTAPTITVGVGSNAVAGVVPRRLKLAGVEEYIDYELHQNATAIVTDTAMTLTDNTDNTYSGTIFATTTVLSTATVGSYADSVILTVLY
jgi:spore coat protein U-like protein